MRSWTIVGLEGLCDDFGYCQPYTAGEIIRCRMDKEELSEEEVERIAQMFNCRVIWEPTK